MNHEYRPQFLDKISGGILRGDNVTYLKGILLEWLHMSGTFTSFIVFEYFQIY